MEDSREEALKILQEVLEERHFLSASAAYENSEHRSFLNMLLKTALRRLVFIRSILKKYVKKMPGAPLAKYALILGCCEILYMDTPDYAVLNAYVSLAKKHTDKYISGFVNAVLRNICRNKEEILKESDNEFFSHEFFRILNQDYGKGTIKKIQTASAQEPLLDITCKSNPEHWAQLLQGKMLPNGSIRIENQGKIEKLPGYSEGSWWVQDFSSSLAVPSAGQIKGKKILELCAAPGGKTAQLINNGGEVTALDISEDRLKKLRQNMKRLQLEPKEIIAADGIKYLKENAQEKYDCVFLDAPCSATGTLRRHPEVVHIKSMKDIEAQAKIQQEFLNAVPDALNPGGLLIYCTCSISKAEGEKQIGAFINRHPEFEIVPIHLEDLFPHGGVSKDAITPEGFVRLLPFHLEQGCDSFFIAKLRKGK